MADNKKSFIAYVDWKDTFDVLPDDKAGQLIKHIFAYVSDENPQSDDLLINAVFSNFKATLKRDLKKWERQHAQRVAAGKKSAEQRQRASTTVERPLNEPEQASTVSGSVSGNGSVTDSDDDVYNRVIIIKSEDAIKHIAKDESLINAIAQKVPEKYIRKKLPQFPDQCIRLGENAKNLRMFEKHFSGWVQKEWKDLSVASKQKYR